MQTTGGKIRIKVVTCGVADLHTKISRVSVLETLMRFLAQQSHPGRIDTLVISDTLRMARLVLDTNDFAYQDKQYAQIRGGAMISAFTMTVANIYMLEWGTVLDRTSTGMRLTLWPVSTGFSM